VDIVDIIAFDLTGLLYHLRTLARQKDRTCCYKWILLLDAMQDSVSSRPELSTMKLDTVKELAIKCGIEQNLQEVLKFLHAQGLLFYVNEEGLRDLVVLHPARLSKAIQTIFSELSASEKAQLQHRGLLSRSEVQAVQESGRLSNETIQQIWIQQGFSAETQDYLRALMVKFGLAVDDPITPNDLIIPCLVVKQLELQFDYKKMKRWVYKIESVTPPVGFSSTVIAPVLQLGSTEGVAPSWRVYRDGCSLVLHNVKVHVRVQSRNVQLYLVIPEAPGDDNHRADGMAKVLVDTVRVIQTAQESLVKAKAKGGLVGMCLGCNVEFRFIDDLKKLRPQMRQFCCTDCRQKMGTLVRLKSLR